MCSQAGTFHERRSADAFGVFKNAAPKNLLRRAASPPHPFFSENSETPFYAVKAVVPFSFSYFIFDEFWNLMGADLPKTDENIESIFDARCVFGGNCIDLFLGGDS